MTDRNEENLMKEFVTPEIVEQARKKAHRLSLVFRCLTAGTLALFIVLCCLIRTGNAGVLFRVMVFSMIPLGWACIAVYALLLRPARGNAAHLAHLLSGEQHVHEGRFHLSEQSFQIPGSARVRKATLTPADVAPARVLGGDVPSADPPEEIRLNFDDAWTNLAPPENALVRVKTSGTYIIGIEPLESAPAFSPRKRNRWKSFRRAFSLLFPGFVLWAMMVVILGGFVFNQITDTAPRSKITLYADLDGFTRSADLAAELEKAKPDPIRMVQVHPFSYALFGSDALKSADLYIVPASHVEEYRDWFAPLPEAFADEKNVLRLEDVPYGLLLSDPASDVHIAGAWLPYPDEPCYLFFGAASPHREDQLALPVVQALLRLP